MFVLCLVLGAGSAQTVDKEIAFEVASVKVHKPVAGEPPGSSFEGGPGTSDPERITVINRPLRSIIVEAYGIKGLQIVHPQWVGERRYDILAKAPPGATQDQAKAMMRKLLAERFQLRIRRETRLVSVYALVVAKDGLKMKLSADPLPSPNDVPPKTRRFEADRQGLPVRSPAPQAIVEHFEDGIARAMGENRPLWKIASWLSARLSDDRPVIDLTGLKGNYDFSLTWNFDPETNLGNFFSAIEKQLGLKLEPRKLPFEMLVVISALEVPTEN
jgi:uncharacterized protein (TIGR03435 family)